MKGVGTSSEYRFHDLGTQTFQKFGIWVEWASGAWGMLFDGSMVSTGKPERKARSHEKGGGCGTVPPVLDPKSYFSRVQRK